MRKNGNHSQWGKGDEPEALIEEDIRQGNLYVLEEASIHAVFAFIIGEQTACKYSEYTLESLFKESCSSEHTKGLNF